MAARKATKRMATRTAAKAAKTTVKKQPSGEKASALKRTWLLNIDYGLCQGCGGCAEAFPQLFEMREERAWIINADRFDKDRDAGVRTICPYYAISVEEG